MDAIESESNAPPKSGDTERQDDVARTKSLALSQRRAPAISVPGLTILRCLGEGAYGSVWQAREKNTGKLVAVKVYSHRGGLDWSLLSREVEKLATLYTSRNVVGLLEVGWDSDPPYYVMEYLERGSLAALLADGPLPAREAVRIAKGILQALVHAHGSGILHCDLKPANVLLDTDFEPRLCDFGQSRLSCEQVPALGTLFYMAPEQADLQAVPDARWDVYALGAVLYHLLCGAPPHRTPDAERRIESAASLDERLAEYRRLVRDGTKPIAHRRVPRVDRRLAEIVDHCLEPEPSKRFPNAQAVLDALDQRERSQSFRPLLALGGLGPVLLMLALGMFYLDSMRDAVDSATRNVTTRALESDVLSVEILARSVARELEKRTAELEELAEDPQLAPAIKANTARNWSDRNELWLLLAQSKSRADKLQHQLGLDRDRSWFLTDERGFQRWREPLDESTLDEDWSHRDYFHGLGDQYEKDTIPADIKPISKPHLSLSYKSAATGRGAISLTVPVWDDKHERVIAVLGRSMQIGQLLAPYAPREGSSEDAETAVDHTRRIALVDDRRWQLLDHPWMTDERFDQLSDVEKDQLRLSDDTIVRLRSSSSIGIADELSPTLQMKDYLDPVGQLDPQSYGGEWLAAFRRVGDTGWFVIVQERKSAVLRPVNAMASRLRRDGAWALAVSGILIGTLWLVVLRGLKERSERPALFVPNGREKEPSSL